MKKFTPVEWQTFSQKKDIENILKKLNASNTFQLTAYAEIALVVFGVALSNIFIDSVVQRTIWVIILALSTVVIAVPLIILCIRKFCAKKNQSILISPKDFIDSFDNDICFYILTAESYHTTFLESADDDTISSEVKRFYFIETCYYLNKAIMTLSPIHNMSHKVIGYTKDEVVTGRLISISRYYNACNLIREIYDNLNQNIEILNDLKNKELIIESNHHYYKCLRAIETLVKRDAIE